MPLARLLRFAMQGRKEITPDTPVMVAIIGIKSAPTTSTADASLTHDIAEAPSCLDGVAAIKPKTYKYNDSPDTRTHWGFIAQDVAAAMREAGHADFGGHIPVDEMNHHEGLAYHELTAVLWRAVQELSAEVAELKGRLH